MLYIFIKIGYFLVNYRNIENMWVVLMVFMLKKIVSFFNVDDGWGWNSVKCLKKKYKIIY